VAVTDEWGCHLTCRRRILFAHSSKANNRAGVQSDKGTASALVVWVNITSLLLGAPSLI
jgi:hypothetical protein